MRGLGMRKCKMILSIMILSILALSISCVTNPDIRQLSPETRARAGKIIVYKGFSIPEDKYQVIGYIEGISCKGSPSYPGSHDLLGLLEAPLIMLAIY